MEDIPSVPVFRTCQRGERREGERLIAEALSRGPSWRSRAAASRTGLTQRLPSLGEDELGAMLRREVFHAADLYAVANPISIRGRIGLTASPVRDPRDARCEVAPRRERALASRGDRRLLPRRRPRDLSRG
jgi:hypothetical protein